VNKLLPLLAFSILLLVPVGAQNAFANHPAVCPFGGFLNSLTDAIIQGTTNTNFCIENGNPPVQFGCSPNYSSVNIDSITFPGIIQQICGALPVVPTTTTGQCLNNAVIQGNHCVPDFDAICTGGSVQSGITCIAQAMNNLVGGTLLETNTLPLLVGAIGVNPIITGLVGITIAGVAGQAVWFVHRRKKKVE